MEIQLEKGFTAVRILMVTAMLIIGIISLLMSLNGLIKMEMDMGIIPQSMLPLRMPVQMNGAIQPLTGTVV
jgi:hypothetical protein